MCDISFELPLPLLMLCVDIYRYDSINRTFFIVRKSTGQKSPPIPNADFFEERERNFALKQIRKKLKKESRFQTMRTRRKGSRTFKWKAI